MLRGENYWSKGIVAGMREWKIGERTVLSYADLPPSPYRMLAQTAEGAGDKPAILTDDGNSYTYAQVLRLADEVAERLAASGVSHGSRVGLLLGNGIEFVVSYFAASSLGAVAVPFPTKFRRGDLVPLVEGSQISHLICERQFASWPFTNVDAASRWVVDNGDAGRDSTVMGVEDRGRPRSIPVVGDLADVAILMFTSGTTSAAKRVMISNFNVAHAVEAFTRTLGITGMDSAIIAVPICNVTGMVGLLSLLVKVGATIYLQRQFKADRFVRTVEREGITFIHASPTVFRLMLRERERVPSLPSVRLIVCGAAHASEPLIHATHAWMPNMSFRTAYGMTETTSVGTLFPADAAVADGDRVGSSGVPTPGLRVRICDETGSEVPDGVCGEICLQGPGIALGYDGVTDGIGSSGWLRTGDIGYVVPDGYLHVVGRAKDIVNRGGEKIACVEVEEELQRVPGVADAALVAVPDELYGEVAAAAVVMKEGWGLDEDGLRKSLSEKLARYKIPSYFIGFEALPLTAGLKTDKKAIRAAILAAIRPAGS